jgi:hypothetical protein
MFSTTSTDDQAYKVMKPTPHTWEVITLWRGYVIGRYLKRGFMGAIREAAALRRDGCACDVRRAV